LRPQAAARSATSASSDALRHAFPPLPPGRAPELSLPEVLVRSAHDSSGSLTNRLVTMTGFVLNERDGMDLARIVIFCCAADAQLARIHLRGDAVLRLADNTWLRVEGRVKSGAPIPTLDAVTVTRVDAPANPYA
jgi:putative membrane protein